MNKIITDKDLALKKIRKHKKYFEKQFGVTRIGVFGSVARNEASSTSDVDIVVEMKNPDLFYMVHIKETLENEFQRPVDIVRYRDNMNMFLKEQINTEAIYV